MRFNNETCRYELLSPITRSSEYLDLEIKSLMGENLILDSLCEDAVRRGLECHVVCLNADRPSLRYLPPDSSEIEEPIFDDSLIVDIPICGGFLLNGSHETNEVSFEEDVSYSADVNGACSFLIAGPTYAFLYSIYHNLCIDSEGFGRYIFTEYAPSTASSVFLSGMMSNAGAEVEVGYYCQDLDPNRIWSCYYSISYYPIVE